MLKAKLKFSAQRRKVSAFARSAFTLIEVMVVVVLLSFITIALMAVFNSTQSAFRASVTQSGVMESGRAALDLMAQDLRQMAPSFGQSNTAIGAVNFYATNNLGEIPLVQSLVGTTTAAQRTNVLENFFVLSRENNRWSGVGYFVITNSPVGLYSLYRFTYPPPGGSVADPATIFRQFQTNLYFALLYSPTNASHLMDGVVSLTVRAYDANGGLMTTNIVTFPGGQAVTNKNVAYFPPQWGETGFAMFSNTLPSAVEIQMGVLEDRTLQRAESLSAAPAAENNYLTQQAGHVHVFRQRVFIPNFDPSAYQ